MVFLSSWALSAMVYCILIVSWAAAPAFGASWALNLDVQHMLDKHGACTCCIGVEVLLDGAI